MANHGEKQNSAASSARRVETGTITRYLIAIDRAKDWGELRGAIQDMLHVVGEYAGADRAFLFTKTDPMGGVYRNSFEWCAEGVKPQMGLLQGLTDSDMPHWCAAFEKGENIVIPDLEAARTVMPAEYEILKVQDIHSEVAVPIFYRQRLSGFIGLDNPEEPQSAVLTQMLALVGSHLGGAHENYRVMTLLEEKQAVLRRSLAELEREKQLLTVLCADYTSVYRADLMQDTLEIVKLDETANAFRMMPDEERAVVHYSDAIAQYACQYVADDARRFRARLDRAGLIAKLAERDRVTFRYQSRPNAQGHEYFEVQVHRLQAEAGVCRALIGFRQIDDLVREERQQRSQLEAALAEANLNNAIVSAISKIYATIYRIDLKADVYEEVSSDGTAHRLTGRAGKASAQLAELCDKYVVPEYKARVAHFFDLTTLARRMGAEETIAFEYPTADGNWHLARFIAKHREDDGTVGSVLYVTQLISDQKRREQFWIVAAEEANRASEAKSDFLSRMSHDIRTPMNAVMGLVNIARQHPEDRQKLLECINKIGVAGENLQQLVNDVLDMTQIERGEFAVNPQKMSLARVVKALNETLRDAAEAKDLRFRCESHDIRRDCLVADPLRLHQVYMNLLSNAIKYTPAGGTVRFELYEEELPKDQKVKLTAVVADTGIGMDPAFMKVMYSKFSRAVDTRVNKVRGSGLGLAIVKQIVDLMHGTIDVQSTVGEGTTFRVTLELPWGEGEPAPQDALEGAAADLDCRGIRLLVAEDNELNYDIEAELLALYGMECVRAEDGDACVRRFREAPAGTFTAILMDMQMPVMDGLQAAAAIRALPRPDAGTIPIIAVTANAYQADVEKCLAAGMNDHLSKPLDVKKVIRTVKKYRK